MYLIAFSSVFTSILSILLLDVFVKKGSLIFVKMSEDLEIDAVVKPSLKLSEDGEFMNFHFNFTNIENKDRLAPRIILEAIDEIRGRELNKYHDDESHDAWRNTFNEVNLPQYDEVYEQKANNYHILRTVNFIKTDLEKEIGIGEDYTQGPIPFGECFINHGWLFHNEIAIFKFRFDYMTMASEYNKLAEEHDDWDKI